MEIQLKTIENDEAYLRQISTDIDFKDDDYRSYISSLKDYCENNAVFALSPIQIGIPKRIIYIRNTKANMDNNFKEGYNEGIVYINPTIISMKGKTKFLEGCQSCSYKKDDKLIYYSCIVDRPYLIEIEYYDINGNKKNKTLEGFESTVFSHEYDHLNGILHMDRSNEIFEMTTDEMKEYRTSNPYEVISKSDDFNYLKKSTYKYVQR